MSIHYLTEYQTQAFPNERESRNRRSANSLVTLGESLQRLTGLAEHSTNLFASPLGPFSQSGEFFVLPRFMLLGENASDEAWRIAIYAGLDGRDKRSSIALTSGIERFVLDPSLGRDFNLVFYPMVNPSGVVDGTIGTRSGHRLDELNWVNSPAPELALIERDARAMQFHGMIVVRTDPGAEELRGLLRGFSPSEPFLHAEPVKGSSKAGYLPFRFPISWEPHPESVNHSHGPMSLSDDLRAKPFEITLLVPGVPRKEWAIQAVAHTLRVFLNNFRIAVATGMNI